MLKIKIAFLATVVLLLFSCNTKSKEEKATKINQKKEERVNLVYDVKVKVKNDGSLKIGMPAEMWIK